MAVIPIVQRQGEVRGLPTGSVSPELSVPKLSLPQANAPYAQLGQAVIGADLAKGQVTVAATDALIRATEVIKKRSDTIALMDADNASAEWENQNIYDPQNGALAKRGTNAFGVTQNTISEYNKHANQVRESLAPWQRAAFDERFMQRRTTIERQLGSHERSQINEYENNVVKSKIDANANRIANNYTEFGLINSTIEDSQMAYSTWADLNGVDPETKALKLSEIESAHKTTAILKMMDTNPQLGMGYYGANVGKFTAEDADKIERVMKPAKIATDARIVAKEAIIASMPSATDDQMIRFVMNDLEGGGKVVSDGGGVSKFGINSVANPDIDVANLTPEAAANLYKERYMKGKEGLPPVTKLIAFDAAVNHGPEFAKGLLEKSGGDPQKMLELRAEEYARLATSNPEKYADQYNGWMERLNKVAAQAEAIATGRPPSEFEIMQRIDTMAESVDVAEKAREMASKELKAYTDSIKQTQEYHAQRAWDMVNQGYEPLPSDVGNMKPEDVKAMNTYIQTNGQPDLKTVAEVRGKILRGEEVNLSEYRWKLGNQWEEMNKLFTNPVKKTQTRTIENVLDDATGMILGKKTASSEDDFVKVDKYRRAIQSEINAFEAQTGKAASPEDVLRMSDRMLLKADTWGTTYKFEADKFEAENISRDMTYLTKEGAPIDYDMLINALSASLEAQGVQVTNESLTKLFEDRVNSGFIIQKEVP